MTDSDKMFEGASEYSVTAELISPITLLSAALLAIDYIRGMTFATSPQLVFIFVGFLVVTSLLLFIPALKFGKRHAIYLIIYHITLAFALIFIVNTQSYYLLLWVLLAYITSNYYQVWGLTTTLALLLVVMIASVSYQAHGLTVTHVLDILPAYTMVAALCTLLARIGLGNRKQRLAMKQKITQAGYEHERLIALINSVSEAVIAINQEGQITLFNAAALDLIDTNMELTGQAINNVLRLRDEKNNGIDMLKLIRDTKYIQRRSDLIMPVGSDDHIALDVNISRVSITAPMTQKQEGYILLLRDITQEKSLDEERELFISEVSHELRTPLTIAEANVSMAELSAGKPDMDRTKLVEVIAKAHKQILFLADMVNDLSTLSRAQRPDAEMDVATFLVQEVIDELIRTYAPQAQKKNLYLHAQVAPDLPQVTTSRLYFKEIMQNFITNAIKYTPSGGVTVIAQLANDHTLQIGVRDTGIGISKSELNKVYEKFWRSEDPYTRQTSGTGLGLFITAKLAKRIGAQLNLESELKKGSTFSLLLPVVAVKDVDVKNLVKEEVQHLYE